MAPLPDIAHPGVEANRTNVAVPTATTRNDVSCLVAATSYWRLPER